MPSPPPGVRLNTRSPFRAQDALAAGISRRQLLSPAYRRIVRGIFIDAGVRHQPVHDALGVLLVAGKDAFVSHHTAARLYGAVVPDTCDLHASVRGDRHRSRTVGVTVHKSARRPGRMRGVPVTSPTHTFLDLVGHLELVDLVILGDSLVRGSRTTPTALVEAATSSATHRTRALRAARLVRVGVDSPMETRLRLLIVLAGLPEPEVNIEIRDTHGVLLRRIDLGYRTPQLGLEYDGRQHAESPGQYAIDIRRREELAALGWHEWTAVSRDLFQEPEGALSRIVAAMRMRGMAVPVLRDDWRAHFRARR